VLPAIMDPGHHEHALSARDNLMNHFVPLCLCERQSEQGGAGQRR
jgi:hypothetical protein